MQQIGLIVKVCIIDRILADILDIIFTRTGFIIMHVKTGVICTYDCRILDLIDILFLVMRNYLLFYYGTSIIFWYVRGKDFVFTISAQDFTQLFLFLVRTISPCMLYSFLTDSALRIEDDTDFWFKEYGREFGVCRSLEIFGETYFFIFHYLRT